MLTDRCELFDSLGMELTRTVTDPIMQVSLGERMKGWQDDYRNVDEEASIVCLETAVARVNGHLPNRFCYWLVKLITVESQSVLILPFPFDKDTKSS